MSEQPENPFEFEEQAPPGHAYEKMVPRSKRMWTAALILVCILAMEAYGIWILILPSRVANWPKTPGTIVESDLYEQTFGTQYQVRIQYRYEVAGVAYKSHQVTCDPEGSPRGKVSEVLPLLEQFTEGAEVGVFYDPDNPRKSYLLAQVSQSQYVMVVVLFGLAVIVAAYLALEWRRGKRQATAGNA